LERIREPLNSSFVVITPRMERADYNLIFCSDYVYNECYRSLWYCGEEKESSAYPERNVFQGTQAPWQPVIELTDLDAQQWYFHPSLARSIAANKQWEREVEEAANPELRREREKAALDWNPNYEEILGITPEKEVLLEPVVIEQASMANVKGLPADCYKFPGFLARGAPEEERADPIREEDRVACPCEYRAEPNLNSRGKIIHDLACPFVPHYIGWVPPVPDEGEIPLLVIDPAVGYDIDLRRRFVRVQVLPEVVPPLGRCRLIHYFKYGPEPQKTLPWSYCFDADVIRSVEIKGRGVYLILDRGGGGFRSIGVYQSGVGRYITQPCTATADEFDDYDYYDFGTPRVMARRYDHVRALPREMPITLNSVPLRFAARAHVGAGRPRSSRWINKDEARVDGKPFVALLREHDQRLWAALETLPIRPNRRALRDSAAADK